MVPTSSRPNLLLITTDQQRFDALGYNGPRVLQTPNLDTLAARGVFFRRGYSTCPVCIPARRSLVSGLHPHNPQHGLRGYRDGLEFDPPVTLPGLLGSEGGYQTQLIGKLHLHPQGKRYGFDHMVLSETSNHRPGSETQKRNDYVDWLRRRGVDQHPHLNGINGNGRLARPFQWEESLHWNTWLAEEAVRFLTEKRDPSCPWFLHLSFFTPHPPLTPPALYYDRYKAVEDQLPKPLRAQWNPPLDDSPAARGIAPDSAVGPFDPEIISNAYAGYYGLINHIDDCIAHVLESYFQYGSPRAKEPTYIAFTSDHGEMLGDHHLFRKSLPYEGSAHVPFFLSGRNVELPGRQSDTLACLEDLVPTFLELGGVEVPEGLDGRSLAPELRAGPEPVEPVRDTLFGECANQFPHHFILRGDYKYVWFGKTQEEQLFNLREDPHETTDLSDQEELLAPFREALEDRLTTRDDYDFQRRDLKPCRNQPPAALYG